MTINFRQISVDFEQKFAGTFVHVKTSSDKQPELFYLRGVLSVENSAPLLQLHNKEKGTIGLSYSTECEITFTFPQSGYFWHNKKDALLFRRLPARRWKRGCCAENSKIIDPYAVWTNKSYSIKEDILKEAFDPIFIPFGEAKELIATEKAFSVPLSRELALGASPSATHPEQVIWFMGKPIASVNGRYIRIRESQFHQEVLDFMQKANEYVQII